MLISVTIEKFRTLSQGKFVFSEGLTAITGETGAGKSLLFDAMALALGQKISRAHGDDLSGYICLVFHWPSHACARRKLESMGLQPSPEGTLSVTLKGGARRRFYLQEQSIKQEDIVDLAPYLVVFHQQNDHLQWMTPGAVTHWLDERLGLTSLAETRNRCRQDGVALDKKIADLASRAHTADARLTEIDAWLQEFEPVAEDCLQVETLLDRQESLKAAKRSSQALVEARQWLASSQGAAALLQQAINKISMQEVSRETTVDALNQAMLALEAGVEDLDQSLAAMQEDQYQAEEIHDRVSVLHQLARKHQVDLTLLPLRYQAWIDEREALSGLDDQLIELRQRRDVLQQQWRQQSSALYQGRQAACFSLSTTLTELMQRLGMAKRLFRFRVLDQEPSDPWCPIEPDEVLLEVGVEGCEEDWRPFTQVLSGGELSRLALALRVTDQPGSEAVERGPCQCLDEVDVGIGGQVAMFVGACLKAQACRQQTLMVTHQAHVAVHADHHLVVDKIMDSGVGHAFRWVNHDERVDEMARMLGRHDRLPEVDRHAHALVERAAAIVDEVVAVMAPNDT